MEYSVRRLATSMVWERAYTKTSARSEALVTPQAGGGSRFLIGNSWKRQERLHGPAGDVAYQGPDFKYYFRFQERTGASLTF